MTKQPTKKKQVEKNEMPVKIPKKVEKFLAQNQIKCETIGHRTVFTAFDKAATLKVKPETIVKVLVSKIDGELAMAVIGGNKNLDIDKLLKLAKGKKIDFAKEKIIGETFKGIDPGAIPPFEKIWSLKVYCDKKLLESPKIIISAGSYEASLKMTPSAFKKTNPDMAIGNFSAAKPKTKKPTKTALKKRKK